MWYVSYFLRQPVKKKDKKATNLIRDLQSLDRIGKASQGIGDLSGCCLHYASNGKGQRCVAVVNVFQLSDCDL